MKCKELRINFRRKPNEVTVIEANGNSFETIKSAKVLCVAIKGDLKLHYHVDNITVKASQRIYLPSNLSALALTAHLQFTSTAHEFVLS